MNQKKYTREKQRSQKLLMEALFGENGFTQITALIWLSKDSDPELGWLLETVLKNERIFKSGSR